MAKRSRLAASLADLGAVEDLEDFFANVRVRELLALLLTAKRTSGGAEFRALMGACESAVLELRDQQAAERRKLLRVAE